MQQNRLENRTSCNAFSRDFQVSGTFERHVTRYDWPMYRAIGRLRAGESYRVAAPLLFVFMNGICDLRYISASFGICMSHCYCQDGKIRCVMFTYVIIIHTYTIQVGLESMCRSLITHNIKSLSHQYILVYRTKLRSGEAHALNSNETQNHCRVYLFNLVDLSLQ